MATPDQHRDRKKDDQLADRLADFHDRLLTGSPADSRTGDASFDDLASVLEMIERVRRTPEASIDTSKLYSTDGTRPSTPFPLAPTEMPETVGRFRIERLLGQGGHGVVLLAHDPQLKRPVALKIPRAEVLVSPEAQRRFFREAEASAALNHPNIVPVYEVGRAGPLHYIAAAYVEGQTLAGWLADQSAPLPVMQCAELLVTLADAVQHAHRRGILHRDLKPANILIDRESSSSDAMTGGKPLITDFGLARMESTESLETRTGTVLGTPAYMSPEQARGETERIGPHTDVYALGVILYELLTGRPPFLAQQMLDTLDAVRRQEPKAPRQLRANIPRDLEAICLKCLEKEPGRRYGDCAEFIADLERFMSALPIKARPVTRFERVGRWFHRNPGLGISSVAIAVLLVAISTGSTLAYLRIAREQRRTLAAQQQADRDFRRSLAAINSMLAEMGGLKLASEPGMHMARRTMLEEALQLYTELLAERGDDRKLIHDMARAELWRSLIEYSLDNSASAIAHMQSATDRFQGLVEQNPGDPELVMISVRAFIGLAEMLRNEQEFDAAKEYFGRVLAAGSRMPPESADNPNLRAIQVLAAASLAAIDEQRGETSDARSVYESGIEELEALRKQYPGIRDVQNGLTSNYDRLVVLLQRDGDYQAARAVAIKSVALWRQLVRARPYPETQAKLSGALDTLANVCSKLNELPEADEAHREAIAMMEYLLAINPDLIRNQLKLATMLANHGYDLRSTDPGEAESRIRRAIEIMEELLLDESMDPRDVRGSLSNSYNNLGTTLDAQGRSPDEVRPLYDKAIEQRRLQVKDQPDNASFHSELGATLNNLNMLLRRQEKHGEAWPVIQEAVEHQTLAVAKDPSAIVYRQYLFRHYLNYVDTLIALGEYEALEVAAGQWSEACGYDRRTPLLVGNCLEQCGHLVMRDEAIPLSERKAMQRDYWGQSYTYLAQAADQIEIFRGNHGVRNKLAFFLVTAMDHDHRDPERALLIARELTAAAPEAAALWETLSFAQYHTGDFAGALDSADKADAITGNSGWRWYVKAMALAQLDRLDEARDTFEQAAAWRDEHHPHHQALEQLHQEANVVVRSANKRGL